MTEQVVQGSGLGPEAVLTDHGEVLSLEGGRVVLLPYCDNSHAAGTDKEKVAKVNARIQKHLESKGFVIHDIFGPVSRHRSLGYVLDGRAWSIEPFEERVASINAAWQAIARGEPVAGYEVARVLGHTVHAFCVRPELLSIFRAAYEFIAK